jgi:hypothetical protein
MKALIICDREAHANAVRPGKLADYLRGQGYEADLFETPTLSRAGGSGVASRLPGLRTRQLALYLLEAAGFLARRLGAKYITRTVTSLTIRPMMQLRGQILCRKFRSSDYDVIICETNLDIGLAACKDLAPLRILDLPAPNAEELYFGGDLSQKDFQKVRALERALYSLASYLFFHWPTYLDYVRKNKYDGPNLVKLAHGIDVKAKRATFSPRPRIVFLGSLGGTWANVPLLVRLCKLYPHIDVYGSPRQKALGAHYKGYAPSTDVLADYQIGLVTVTDDPLRRSSFSSKQLEYYSYGLPALSPDWRSDAVLDPAALLYNEANFLSLIDKFQDRSTWEQASAKALAIAEACTWPQAFEPMGKILRAQRETV